MVKNQKQDTVLVLRTCNSDMTAWSGFKWPKRGYIEAPDWNPDPGIDCGQGLHGLLWGEGDGELLNWCHNAKWLVIRVKTEDMVPSNFGDKVRFRTGYVIHCGDRQSATQYLYTHGKKGATINGVSLTGGDYFTLRGGDLSILTSGDYSILKGGNRSVLTGGGCSILKGGFRSILTGGRQSTLTGGDRSILTGGDRSILTGGDDSTLKGGKRSVLTGGFRSTLTGGYLSTLTGRDDSTLMSRWWDGDRHRIAVGYIGENGLKPNTPYRFNVDKQQFIEVK